MNPIPWDNIAVTACVVWLEHDNNDLRAEAFASTEDAKAWTEDPENSEYKAIIIGMESIGGGECKLTKEDRT